MEDKLISYGGQALMEGVLMRGRKSCAVAMRAPDGNIVTKFETLGGTAISGVSFLGGVSDQQFVYFDKMSSTPLITTMISAWSARSESAVAP